MMDLFFLTDEEIGLGSRILQWFDGSSGQMYDLQEFRFPYLMVIFCHSDCSWIILSHAQQDT